MDDFHKQKTLPDVQGAQTRIPVPKTIGPYKIESVLSKGGMSVLYLGTNAESQPIVVKVLLPKFLKNKEIANRFLNEAEIIGMSNHPNIVRLYGQGQWEKGLYIAMEFIQGISLRQFIQQKSLTQKRALEIILQVAYALCHLHTHGVIHRDLKPENIIITESGEIKVIDFGIAQLQRDVEAGRITQKKRLMGTPTYMSPEQKENPSAVSYASDVYSLGIIAYELLLGRLSHGVIHLALLPKKLRGIIEKALRIDPKERYGDIVEFITDISQYIRGIDEEKEEEVSDEVVNLIQHAKSVLIPRKAPDWPQIEVGIAVQEGGELSGLYLDFFHLSGNRYVIVLGEPVEVGVASLVQASVLRGMVRMVVGKDFHPVKTLGALNEALQKEKVKFAFSFLMLSPDKDQLSFVGCQASDLWHLPDGSKKVRALATPNGALGVEGTFLETADNWHVGDTAILHTLKKEDGSWVAEHSLLAPQAQAERILQKLAKGKKISAVISIQRIF